MEQVDGYLFSNALQTERRAGTFTPNASPITLGWVNVELRPGSWPKTSGLIWPDARQAERRATPESKTLRVVYDPMRDAVTAHPDRPSLRRLIGRLRRWWSL
ncbi:hypothetical protein [Amorphus sp. MBR-141]